MTGATKTTKARKSADRKPTTRKTTAVEAPTPEVVVQQTPLVSEPELKKKELIEAVVERSGVKKRDAKPVVEAMLAILGETIADGRELNLAPMGKMKITRMKRTTSAQIITTRLRRNDPKETPAPDPLAQAAE